LHRYVILLSSTKRYAGVGYRDGRQLDLKARVATSLGQGQDAPAEPPYVLAHDLQALAAFRSRVGGRNAGLKNEAHEFRPLDVLGALRRQ
jgi:hypothetical protein